MRRQDLEAMDFEELWMLHEELTKILAEKIKVEKQELEKRLAQLNQPDQFGQAKSGAAKDETDQPPRRKYPKVVPKYFNPLHPTETWSGRGKQPRWLVAALQLGHTLEEFRIRENDESSDRNAGGQSH
ncbi:H-NS histone family protein [Bradyrhizobium sp. CSS354]|jgi:DNA-binding protein H-NS|uniref:H-NS histone family protein n=1 Tax=unclassified Bradyrhizobium TaxID=2631580 RepID=UPI0023B1EC2E|nr:H-NS histone family protein [Bradyrhizobium sp. CSS354]MDE5465466.1 H-NS histone family protein [Bradyrhizobium sp. CSS354]